MIKWRVYVEEKGRGWGGLQRSSSKDPPPISDPHINDEKNGGKEREEKMSLRLLHVSSLV